MAVESMLTREELIALFDRRQEALDNMDASALSIDYADDCVVESPGGRHAERRGRRSRTPRVVRGVPGFEAPDRTPHHRRRARRAIDDHRGDRHRGVRVCRPVRASRRPRCSFMSSAIAKSFAFRIYDDFTGVLIQIGLLSKAGLAGCNRPSLVKAWIERRWMRY